MVENWYIKAKKNQTEFVTLAPYAKAEIEILNNAPYTQTVTILVLGEHIIITKKRD